MLKRFMVLLLGILLVLPLSVSAQEEDAYFTDPLFLWSAGQLDPLDLNVYYSFFLATGAEDLSDLTLTGNLPEGATFVDAFWQPEGAVFVGEADGVVTWEMPALTAATIAGPFTFRVTFENSDAEDFAPVAAAEGAVTWGDETLAAQSFGDETLAVMEASGEVTIEPSGTVDLVPVGDTGAWIFVPADAVSETVTLTIERVAITEDSALPEVAEETWWCGQYSISADKDVSFNQEITLILPIRRALTPSMEIAVFGVSADGSWLALSDGEAETTEGETASAFVSRDGLLVSLSFSAASFGTTPSIFAVGVSTAKRTVSTGSTSRSGSDPAPWF